MDAVEQAEGEKRVMRILVDPLKARGLAKPSSLTVTGFDEMVSAMCAKLAYMSEISLAALEEQVAANPGGKDRDRFPIANQILQWAAEIQPPGDSASPLMRAVFAHQIGQNAIAEGWGPELLAEIRKTRRWPGSWSLKTVRDAAGDAVRRMRDLDARLARTETLSPDEVAWRERRLAALQKCRDITEGGAA
ncbi:hypothetical protein PE067_08230 [Paracoccus sp. DMF-8]|uniref:hypothetical protein n=1 Tax=Paracoccus sp. DMF-8 TaxID=3019445 RepID=UPI0023E86909|nr:hypothetical protein [Paracoccus sp. DMF-8]MDF3606115.1 hypothetical protein [Paracoccus sp. DMF-8]